ncbi:MAG: sel1 repeat family protein [Muribaculaceae bacterium]|nr:sel1 repeat family protein [Muribaculaceae bacterium]
MNERRVTLRWLTIAVLPVLALACTSSRVGWPSAEQQRLARQGDVPAIKAMARWSADITANPHADLRQAAQWWSMASQAGDGEGNYQLGRCYEQALGVEADTVCALRLYRAALQLDTTGAVREQLHRQATEGGSAVCAVALARAHLHGTGVRHDIDQAKAYYHIAAEQHYALAVSELAQISYLEDFGQQLKEAIERQETFFGQDSIP